MMASGLFGKEIRKEFYLNEEVAFINHGSFGAVPRSVYEARLERMKELESNPDDWFKYMFQPLMKSGLESIAKLIGSSTPENVVFVENATTGVTIALRSLDLQPNDGLLISCLSYQSIQVTAHRVSYKEKLIKRHVLNLDPPFNDKSEVVERYRDYLSSHPEIRVAIIDHITSPSTLVLPVKDIVKVCHQFGVVVIIDGAHAPGQIEINVEDIGAEYYTGNLHKWLYCPRGCAFLHVHSDQRDRTAPLLASSNYDAGFPDEFLTQGTRDNTSMTVVPQAMSFYERLGGMEGIHSYCKPLLKWAAKMLSERLNEPLLTAPDDMIPPYMVVVRLPGVLQGDKSKAHGDHIKKVLRFDYNVVAVMDIITGELWIRLSCAVYNVKDDYERLAGAILDLMKHPEKLN